MQSILERHFRNSILLIRATSFQTYHLSSTNVSRGFYWRTLHFEFLLDLIHSEEIRIIFKRKAWLKVCERCLLN